MQVPVRTEKYFEQEPQYHGIGFLLARDLVLSELPQRGHRGFSPSFPQRSSTNHFSADISSGNLLNIWRSEMPSR